MLKTKAKINYFAKKCSPNYTCKTVYTYFKFLLYCIAKARLGDVFS